MCKSKGLKRIQNSLTTCGQERDHLIITTVLFLNFAHVDLNNGWVFEGMLLSSHKAGPQVVEICIELPLLLF